MDFFEEYEKLKLAVPRCALFNIASQNSDYCAYARYNKNSYLGFGVDYNEDLIYAYWAYHNKDCVDICYVYDSELMYDCVDCRKSYNLNFCQDCQTCSDGQFLYNCYGCKNCYGCVNLRQAEFCIFNKKLPREKYFEEIAKYKAMPLEDQCRMFTEYAAQFPRVYMHQNQTQDCAGDYIYNSKNCYACYDVQNVEDGMYLSHSIKSRDSADMDFTYNTELCYDCMSVEGFNCNFCCVVWECNDMEFCELCFNCKNCFGCIGLKRKEFQILNKQYSSEDYFKRVKAIKSELKAQGRYNSTLPEIFFDG